MFRKIASNRDPGVTLAGELHREFRIYFRMAGSKTRQIAIRYPRLCFALMLAAIVVSGVLAFTVMRHREQSVKPGQAMRAIPRFGQMMHNVNALKALWDLQSQVDALLQKGKLSAADSLTISRALAAIDSIRLQVKRDHQQLIKQPQTNSP